ncbi:MAG: type I polyketide synthase [Lysobacter sp.]
MSDGTGTDNLFQSVAIIGAAGRFPGAVDVDQFWANLAAGVDSIRQYSDEELAALGVPDELRSHPSFVRAGARMPGAEDFDPEFFDMTPREAEITDPQHRVLLECAYEAMESAGYVASRYPGAIALYAGVGLNTYLLHNLLPRGDLLRTLGMHQLLLGNDKCYATSRIAYKMNLRGQCLTVDTACSSGLVAVAMAYRSLISYECDMALAGGAKVNASDSGYPYEAGSINSPDGRCRAFDAQASGTVFGSGAGMVVLKRLEDALRDRDNIQAVIRGAAVNNDGSAKVGFTAPSVNRQRDVVRQALSFSEVAPESISYVEAHGTGTRLGDPIEMAALAEAFGNAGPRPQTCAIGSVKTNIGHLEAAAGVAGLIKVVQALRHEQIPPSLNFETPNPAIDFASTPFYVNTQLRPWPAHGELRRASVSSFGLGGTNAHVILEEAPRFAPSETTGPELLLCSAKTATALDAVTRRLSHRLESASAASLADIAHTLACGREHFSHRRFVVAGTRAQAASALTPPGLPAPEVSTLATSTNAPRLAFVFPGQGVQFAGMAAHLYGTQPAYRRALDECCAAIETASAIDLKPLLLDAAEHHGPRLDQTDVAQPAIFATSYAMARLWQSWGIQPDVLLGHSLGEYVAACLAGVFSLDDALALVTRRAKLMHQLPTGAMAALRMSGSEATALLLANPQWQCDLAAINGPMAVVVSGPHEAIEQCLLAVHEQGRDGQVLRTSHAFHSRMQDTMLEEFRAALARVAFSVPQIPFVSCVSGALVESSHVTDPQYWVEQLRNTVRFADGVASAIAHGTQVFVDMGPAATASSMVMANLGAAPAAVIAASPARQGNTDAQSALLKALGEAWSHGVDVAWEKVYGHRECRRVELPAYPFERKRCWVEPPSGIPERGVEPASAPAPIAAVASAREPGHDSSAQPRNESEALVAAIWEELLGVQAIGMHDNFFALGGQSLLATRVMTRINEISGVELPVEIIFEQPTIAGVAQALFERRVALEDPELLERLLAEL